MKVLIISKKAAEKLGYSKKIISMYADIKPLHNYFGMDCYIDSKIEGDKAFVVEI